MKSRHPVSDMRLAQILLAPQISEKSTMLADKYKQVIFKVRRDANKIEIKAAVECLFKVEVSAVTVMNIKGKEKRRGKRSDWKKAIVILRPGQDLNFDGGVQ